MSKYSTAVLADSPLNYWKLQENSGTSATGGTAITQNGSVAEPTGPSIKNEAGASLYDGTNDRGTVAINLSAVATLSLEFWLHTAKFDTEDDLAFEYTANANSNNGFYLDLNTSGTEGSGGGQITTKSRMGEKNRVYRVARPSAAAYHHYVFVYVKNGAHKTYIDGAEKTMTSVTTEAQTGAYANSTLNIMSRNAASLFQQGKLAHVSLYGAELSKARVEAHWAAAAEEEGGGEEPAFLSMLV